MADKPNEMTETQKRIMRGKLTYHLLGRDEDPDDIVRYNEEVMFLGTAAETVREALTGIGWKYSEKDQSGGKKEFRVWFSVGGTTFLTTIILAVSPKTCRIEAVYPITADPVYEYILCRKMAVFNRLVNLGAMQYDSRSGEVSFKYIYSIKNEFDEEDFIKILLDIAGVAATGYEEIRKCCVGSFRHDEVDRILSEVDSLVSDLSENDE